MVLNVGDIPQSSTACAWVRQMLSLLVAWSWLSLKSARRGELLEAPAREGINEASGAFKNELTDTVFNDTRLWSEGGLVAAKGLVAVNCGFAIFVLKAPTISKWCFMSVPRTNWRVKLRILRRVYMHTRNILYFQNNNDSCVNLCTSSP